MLRFLFATFVTAIGIAFYIKWGRAEADQQLDKMQAAVHGTPGTEPPVPPIVLVGGVGLLAGHWLLTRLLWLRFWQAFLSLLFAIGAGFGYYLYGVSGQQR